MDVEKNNPISYLLPTLRLPSQNSLIPSKVPYCPFLVFLPRKVALRLPNSADLGSCSFAFFFHQLHAAGGPLPSVLTMAKNGEYDDDVKDPSLTKAASEHENAAMDSDQISAWQCMAQNPKIVLWTVFANSKSCVRCHHGQRCRQG